MLISLVRGRGPLRTAAPLLLAASLALLGAAGVPAAEPSPREQLERMSPEEKEELAAKRDRFQRLSDQEQQRLRQLDRRLRADPDSRQLRRVMNRYYEWLKTLTSDQRAQLLSQTGEARVEMIKQLTHEQEKEKFRRLADQRLSTDDLEQVYDWMTKYIRSREPQLTALLSPHEREKVEEIDDEARRWRHLFWELRHHELPPSALPSQEEMNELINNLSNEARQIFAAATDDRDRVSLVQRWIRASMFSRLVQSFSEEELISFMQNELDPRIRSHLEALSRDEMQKELRKHYFFHKFSGFRGPPRHRPFGRDDQHQREDRDEQDRGDDDRNNGDREDRDHDRDNRRGDGNDREKGNRRR